MMNLAPLVVTTVPEAARQIIKNLNDEQEFTVQQIVDTIARIPTVKRQGYARKQVTRVVTELHRNREIKLVRRIGSANVYAHGV
jgi:hypothetical protein